MTMRRQVLFQTILLSLVLVLPSVVTSAVIEQLIAVINGEPYTLSNLNRYAKEKLGRGFPSGDLNQINDNDRQVLEQFVTDKLLEAEVLEAGIRIGPDEVERYIEQVKKANRLSDEDLKLALKREGQTPESYRATVKAELEKSEIIDRQVRRKINIRDRGQIFTLDIQCCLSVEPGHDESPTDTDRRRLLSRHLPGQRTQSDLPR